MGDVRVSLDFGQGRTATLGCLPDPQHDEFYVIQSLKVPLRVGILAGGGGQDDGSPRWVDLHPRRLHSRVDIEIVGEATGYSTKVASEVDWEFILLRSVGCASLLLAALSVWRLTSRRT